MNYKGKLYGRIGNNTYFDTAYTTDDWDAMEAKIKEIEKVKRKPLSDGTLPLTESEIEEYKATRGITNPNWSGVSTNGFYVFNKYASGEKLIIADLKTLKWLAERFDLSSNN